MIDFEYAVIDAYKMHFQGIEIKLCHFHFGQSNHKKGCEKWKEQYTSDEKLIIYQ
jgi:hypothetical protein